RCSRSLTRFATCGVPRNKRMAAFASSLVGACGRSAWRARCYSEEACDSAFCRAPSRRAASPRGRRASSDAGVSVPRTLERLQERALQRLHERREVTQLVPAFVGRAQDVVRALALGHADLERGNRLGDDAARELECGAQRFHVALAAHL